MKSRKDLISFLLLFMVVFGTLPWLVHPWYDARNDGSVYILTARSLLAGEGYSLFDVPFFSRPPGFPVMIAPILHIFGTSFFALNLYVSIIGAFGIILFYLYLCPTIGRSLAWLTAMLIWWNPVFRRFSNMTMSDVPAVTLLFVALLMERWAFRHPSIKRYLLLGTTIGLLGYVRTNILLLIPAIVLTRFLGLCRHEGALKISRDQWSRLAVFVMAALVLYFPWSVRNHLVAPATPVDQALPYSYWVAMWHSDCADPHSSYVTAREVWDFLPSRCERISTALGSRLQSVHGGTTTHFFAVFLITSSLIVLARRPSPAESFACLCLLAVLFYGCGAHQNFPRRLLLPVLVLMFPAAVMVLKYLLQLLCGKRMAKPIVAAALFVLIAVDFKPRQGWETIELECLTLTEVCNEFRLRLDPEAKVGSYFGQHYAVVLEMPVYSFQYAFIRAGQDLNVLEELIDRYGLNTVILSERINDDLFILPYFRDRYGPLSGKTHVIRVRQPWKTGDLIR